MTPIPTVGIVVIKDTTILLVRHGSGASHVTGIYGVPGGRIDEGESEIEAAARELTEETGLIADEEGLVVLPFEIPSVMIPRKDGSVKYFSWKVYLCKKWTGELRGTAETTPEWVKIADLDTYELLPNTKVVVTEGLKLLKQV